MKVKFVENSRLVFLTTIRAKGGAPDIRDVVSFIGARYRFERSPASLEEFYSDVRTFQLGTWNKLQIDELAAYGDGFIVSGRVPTNELENFCEDLEAALFEEFDLSRVEMPSDSRHYESSLVVEFASNNLSKLDFLEETNVILSNLLASYGTEKMDFLPFGIQMDVDMSANLGKRPIAFTLVRRIHMPFDAKLWFSTAPLKTADHIALLRNLEKAIT